MRQSPSLSWVIITIIIIIIITQLPLEQHRFELWRSTYMWIFFNRKYYSTTQSAVSWIQGCGTMDMRNSRYRRTADMRTDYKLYEVFQLCEGWAPLTLSLFKDQLYVCCLVYDFFKKDFKNPFNSSDFSIWIITNFLHQSIFYSHRQPGKS